MGRLRTMVPSSHDRSWMFVTSWLLAMLPPPPACPQEPEELAPPKAILRMEATPTTVVEVTT